MIKITRNYYPDYEQRQEIFCTTLAVSCISQPFPTGGSTQLEAILDKGLPTERKVTWIHAKDHPVFVFKEPE